MPVTTDKKEELKITIREMRENELKIVMGWAKKEGWNTGKYDYRSYYAADNQGFLLLLANEKPIGSISIVRHSDTFAFIGLFIVLPEYRKKGYGTILWEAGLQRLSQCTSIGLYSVPQEISRYSLSKFFGQHKNLRWEMPKSKKEDLGYLLDTDQNPENLYNNVINYDASLWGSSRKSFFNACLQQPESHAFITFDKATGKVNGYGMIRPCISGYRIGPIYSDELESAKTLTRLLMSEIPNESKIIFDIPNKNKFSCFFAEFFQLSRVENSDTLAMFKGEIHDSHEEICYGVASLEIG